MIQDIDQRTPPCNLEAERSVLGSCLMDPRAIDEVALILTADDFYRDVHGEFYRAILSVREQGHPADSVTVPDYLEERGRFEEMGGNDFLESIVNAVPHAANAGYYASIVREKQMARTVIEACEETLKECYGRMKTAPELVAALESRVFAIAEHQTTGTTLDMDTVIGRSMDGVWERKSGVPPGVMTGFEDLDDVLCGLRAGTLSILAARPSIGKTAMGMCIAANVGAVLHQPVLFVSMEMDAEEIGDRFLSASAEVNGRSLKDPYGLMDADAWKRLSNAAGRLINLPIKIDDASTRTVGQIMANARRIKRRHGLAMVIIDYLGLIDGERQRGESRQEEVARISKRLRIGAKELGVPVMALHQLNREPESRNDRRPRMSDLRESGAIEQDAHVVLLLHRPEFYDPMDRPGVAEVIVAKNRSGATAPVEVAFRKEWTRFETKFDPTADRVAY